MPVAQGGGLHRLKLYASKEDTGKEHKIGTTNETKRQETDIQTNKQTFCLRILSARSACFIVLSDDQIHFDTHPSHQPAPPKLHKKAEQKENAGIEMKP